MGDPQMAELAMQREQERYGPEDTDADLAADEELAQWFDSIEEETGETIHPGDEAEAATLVDLAERAAAAGVDGFDLARFDGEPDAAYAARLWGEINLAEARRGANREAEEGDLRGGLRAGEAGQGASVQESGFALAGQQAPSEAPREVAPTQGGGLFGAPTQQDRIDAARRDRDADRDGRTGAGRADMAAGDGELFAGPRPEQARVDDAGLFDPDSPRSLEAIASGDFGPVLTQYRGDAQGAIAALRELQDGEAVGALSHPDVGEIDLVWGEAPSADSQGYGLAKIVAKHPEVLTDLQGFIDRMTVVEEGRNRIRLASPDGRAVVRLQWDGRDKKWLLTAYEIAAGGSTRTDTAALAAGDDTARPNASRGVSVPPESAREQVEQSRQRGEDEADLYGLRDAVDAAVGEGRVTYLHGVEGLPERLREGVKRRLEQRGGRGRTAALYDPRTKQVYLFTDVVTSPERAVWNALHEIAGHHGLREFLGDRLAPALELALQNPTVKAVADAIARERNIDTRTQRGRLLAAEEALAELAAAVRTGDFDHITSRYDVPVPEGIRARLERALENFLRRLKAALDDLFGRPVFTDEDVRGLLEAAWQSALVNGPTMAVQEAGGSTASEQVVFHGTPHTVDRFSLQRIGTGEGAQAYGWGLYFASRREVAEHYRDNVIDVSWLDERNRLGVELQRAAESGDPAAVAAYEAHQDETARMAEEAQARRGNLYRVDVPEDSDLLDYDAPLSEQPEKVREALRAGVDVQDVMIEMAAAELAGMSHQAFRWQPAEDRDAAIDAFHATGRNAYDVLAEAGVTGEDLYQDTARVHGPRGASEMLMEAGIPGLRYLDGDSRSDGDGSRNYVIWDEAAIGEPQDADALESVERTPEQREMMRKAGVGEDTRTTWTKAKDWLAGKVPDIRKDSLIQGALDQYYGLKQAVEATGNVAPENDPYIAARMVNVASTMEAILRFGAPKMEGGVLRVDRTMPGLLDALTPVADDLPGFFGWMVARRAQVLKKQGRENLLTDADIAAGLSLAEGREAEFNKVAGDYLRLKNAILDFAEKHGGTIDPEARAAWDHAEYIPFYRAEEGGATGPGTRRGIANQTAGIRALKGGEQALNDPLANIFQNFTRLMDSALKNRAMLLAVDQLGSAYFEKLPMQMAPATVPLDQVRQHLKAQGMDDAAIAAMPASTVKGVARMLTIEAPTGDDVIRVMRKGKPEYYRVADPLVLRSITAFHELPIQGWLKPFVWLKNLLTAGATATPDFIIRNTLRDTLEASTTSRERMIPLWDTMRGAVDSARSSELAQDLMMAGSYFHSGYFRQSDYDATAKATRRALRRHGLSESVAEQVGKSLINPKRWWDVYRSGMEASEMGSRVSLARNRQAATGNFLEAAFEAKDFLDFQLKGDSALLQFFIRTIPFLNARLQGNYRLARAATARDRRKAVIGRMAMMATSTAMLYAWNMLAYRDEYDELPDWEKDVYWHIAPGTSRHVRIPKPFELGLVAGTGVERGLAALVHQVTGGEVGDKADQTWAALLRGLGDTLAMNPIPQAVKPGAEVFFNRNTFTDRPIESDYEKKKAPSERRGPRTSETMVQVSRGMEALMGDDALSPKQLEHLWRGYLGGMGMYVLGMADAVARELSGAPPQPESSLRDLPGVGAIYRGDGVAYSTRWTDDFYSLRDEAARKSDRVKVAVEEGDLARARRLEAENAWLLGDRQSSKRAKAGFMHGGIREINRAAQEITKIRKADEAIYASRTMSPREKRDRLEANARKRNEIARRTVNRFNEAKRRAGR